MMVKAFTPKVGYVVTKKEISQNKTESGLELEENTDDFLVHGEIVASSVEGYAVGESIVYHTLMSQSFRDGSQTYNVVQEDDILGKYDPAQE